VLARSAWLQARAAKLASSPGRRDRCNAAERAVWRDDRFLDRRTETRSLTRRVGRVGRCRVGTPPAAAWSRRDCWLVAPAATGSVLPLQAAAGSKQ
jgi:hypothetical protein